MDTIKKGKNLELSTIAVSKNTAVLTGTHLEFGKFWLNIKFDNFTEKVLIDLC